MLSEILQKQYDFEHHYRSELSAATNSPIVGVTLISSATAVAILDYQYSNSITTYIFLMLTVGTVASLAAAVYFTFRSAWNYVYRKLAPAPKLVDHHRALIEWHILRGHTSDEAVHLAAVDFREFVDSKLSEAAEWNGQNNLRRGIFLHMATTSVAVALALFVPLAILYSYARATAPDRVYQIDVTHFPMQLEESDMTAPEENGQGTQGNAPAPAPATVPAQPVVKPIVTESKPVGPPNTEFRTNVIAPKPEVGKLIETKDG